MITLFLLFGLLTTGSEEGGPHWWQGSACIVPGVSLRGTTLPKSTFSPPRLGSPPPVKNRQLQLMWMRRSSSSSSATLARRVLLSKQTNFGTGRFAWILRKGIASIRFGRSPCFVVVELYQGHDHLNKDLFFFFDRKNNAKNKFNKKISNNYLENFPCSNTFHLCIFFFLPSIKKPQPPGAENCWKPRKNLRSGGCLEFGKVINNDPDTGKLLKVAFATRWIFFG